MLILASASPRRAELLRQIGVDFETQVADIDESTRPNEASLAYVQRMAREKAQKVAEQHPQRWVLGSDTSVVLGDNILGKPNDRAHAIDMLLSLAGQTHQVITSVALAGPKQLEAHSISRVRFRNISRDEAEAYWATGEPADKAGGYAVQGRAAVFIEHIAGSYSGIMGLPIFETAQLLEQAELGRLGP